MSAIYYANATSVLVSDISSDVWSVSNKVRLICPNHGIYKTAFAVSKVLEMNSSDLQAVMEGTCSFSEASRHYSPGVITSLRKWRAWELRYFRKSTTARKDTFSCETKGPSCMVIENSNTGTRVVLIHTSYGEFE